MKITKRRSKSSTIGGKDWKGSLESSWGKSLSSSSSLLLLKSNDITNYNTNSNSNTNANSNAIANSNTYANSDTNANSNTTNNNTNTNDGLISPLPTKRTDDHSATTSSISIAPIFQKPAVTPTVTKPRTPNSKGSSQKV